MKAPIALFTYGRLSHTQATVESLLRNTDSLEHDLYIFADAAFTQNKQVGVDQVRAYLATITGFRSVTIYHRSQNYGLAKSIISGVTEVLAEHEKIIVLEDDMVTSPHFLTYTKH
jgi:GT2 family glycosyltransferase